VWHFRISLRLAFGRKDKEEAEPEETNPDQVPASYVEGADPGVDDECRRKRIGFEAEG
jgi:hypothetical protein